MGHSKYHNKKVWYDGIQFDSGKERDYYIYLKKKEQEGEITNLRMQVPFVLIPKVMGKKTVVKHHKRGDKIEEKDYVRQQETKYFADFVYEDSVTGKEEVIDVKSKITRKKESYILKKKMMLAFLGIEIVEVVL
jgi:hypothetical protein